MEWEKNSFFSGIKILIVIDILFSYFKDSIKYLLKIKNVLEQMK